MERGSKPTRRIWRSLTQITPANLPEPELVAAGATPRGPPRSSSERSMLDSTAPSGHFPPVVDLAKWRAGDAEEGRAVARQVEQIFRNEGFCQLVNHCFKEGLMPEAFRMMEKLFALPLETKMRIAKVNSPYFRGYEGVGAEVTNGKVDYREQVDTWQDMAPSGKRTPLFERLKGPSQYFSEEELPGYKEFTVGFMKELAKIGQMVLEILAVGLGEEKDFFLREFGQEAERLHRLKWMHYPKPPEDLSHLCGVHEHKDSGFISLVIPGKFPGLEVDVGEDAAGGRRFLPASLVREDAIVVNLGKSVQALTGNYYVATTHRVAQKEDRYSVAFFYSPKLEMSLNPILHGERYEAAQAAGKERARSELNFLTSALDAHTEQTHGDLVVSLMSRSYPKQAEIYLKSAED